MKRSIRNSVAALFGAAMVSSLLCLGTTEATAQLAWTPPCNITKVINLSGCAFTMTLNTNFGNPSVAVPANDNAGFNFPNGLSINGVMTAAGTFVAMGPGGNAPVPPSPPPPAPPIATAGRVLGVVMGPGCCVDLYFDINNCHIIAVPAANPIGCIP